MKKIVMADPDRNATLWPNGGFIGPLWQHLIGRCQSAGIAVLDSRFMSLFGFFTFFAIKELSPKEPVLIRRQEHHEARGIVGSQD